MDGEGADWKRGFGQRLKAARLARGYQSARVLAEVMDVQENTVTSWERGTRRPSPLDMVKLRRTLGVSLDYLYDDDRSTLPAKLQRIMIARGLLPRRG